MSSTHGAGYFQYGFLHDPQGSVSGFLVRVQGVEFTSPRIDTSTAEQLKAKLRERIQSQKPLPGSEAALRRLVEGIQAAILPMKR
jgi:ribosomal protein S3AE